MGKAVFCSMNRGSKTKNPEIGANCISSIFRDIRDILEKKITKNLVFVL